jgi:hypothetical protein
MRKISGATTATILAISLYFTLFWGFDALRVLTSPSYGLDEVWRAEYIFVLGRMIDAGPVGLMKLAAFFGAVKLVVALVCAWHIVDRFRCMVSGTANAEVLEGALILVVAISIVTAGLAARSGNGEIVREYTIQLVLACLATALCIAERSAAFGAARTQPVEAADDAEARVSTYSGPVTHP